MTITPPCCFCSPWLRYVAAGWMQARIFKRERKSELGGKSVNGCWYGPRKKNSWDWRRRIFWPQAGEWAEEYGNSGFRIPRNSFTCHWIRIASIVLCLDLQSLPTHVSEAQMSCGVFWSLAGTFSRNSGVTSRGRWMMLCTSKWSVFR